MASSLYQIVNLSETLRKSDDVESLVSKFRALRLDALRTSPKAFASTYEVEMQRDLSQSRQRLNNPKAVHLIAVEHTPTPLPLAEQEWLGMIVLLGPENDTSSVAVSATSDPFKRMTQRPSDEEPEVKAKPSHVSHYHLNGVFVCATARRTGLGRALIEATLSKARDDARRDGVPEIMLTILVDSENQAAQHLYETAGFKAVGSEEYVQRPRSLVQGESESKVRVAIQMQLSMDTSICGSPDLVHPLPLNDSTIERLEQEYV